MVKYSESKWMKRKDVAIRYAIMLIGLPLLIFYLVCPTCFFSWDKIHLYWDDLLYTILLTASLWLGNKYLNEYADKKISWIKKPSKRLFFGVGIMLGYSVVVTLFITLVFDFTLFDSNRSTWNDYAQILTFPLIVTVTITTILTSRGFLLSWRQAAIEAERLRHETLRSQYAALQSQLNPHFLFNSLNTLSSLIHENPDAATKFINSLSLIYRYVLEVRRQELVTLQKELGFVEKYLQMLKIRFEGALEITMPPEVAPAKYVPPMSLQLLVENALKHNVLSKAAPLNVTINIEQGDWLAVSNNLLPPMQATDQNGLGLANLAERYKMFTSRKIQVEKTDCHFVVKIPLLQIE